MGEVWTDISVEICAFLALVHQVLTMVPPFSRFQISAAASGKLSKATGISPDQAQAILNDLVEQQRLSPDALESLMQGGFDQALQVWDFEVCEFARKGLGFIPW